MINYQLGNSNVDMTPSQLECRNTFIKLIDEGSIVLDVIEACPSCGSVKHDLIASFDRHGIGASSNLCNECSLIFTSPAISEKSLPLFYEAVYAPLNGFSPSPKHLFNPVQGENIYNYTIEFKDNLKKIADIGCGAGDVVKFLAEKYPESLVLGVDYNKFFVDSYSSGPNHKLLFGGLEELIEMNEKYDLIILSHVLEHVSDIDGFISKLKKVCHEKTYIYIEVPGLFGFFKDCKFYDFNFSRFHTVAHNFNFTLVTLNSFLNKLGLKMIKGDDFIRSVFVFSDGSQGSFEYERVRFFLDKTLPACKKYFASEIVEYAKSNLSKIGFPSKEKAISLLIEENHRLKKELVNKDEFICSKNKEYDEIKAHPFAFYLKSLKTRFF